MSKLVGLVTGHGQQGGNGDQAQAGGSNQHNKGAVRNILVNITGNRASWEHMGIHGALWRINSEKAWQIFSYDLDQNNNSTMGAHSTEHALQERISRSLIKKITVVESHTNIDEVVGISIDGLPPKEFTGNGDGASLFLLGSGKVTEPQEIFNLSGNTELGMAWMKQYPKYTHSNLDVEGVMFLTGASYYFVHEGHPAIHMLKVNQDQLGVQIREETLVNGSWYKVDTEAFLFCVKTLRENILQNAPSTFDLSTLTVRINKPDGQRWLQLPPQVIEGMSSAMIITEGESTILSESQETKIMRIQKYLDKPLFVTLRLAIEYTLPDLPTSSSSHCGNSNAGNPNNNSNSAGASGNNSASSCTSSSSVPANSNGSRK